MVRRALAIFGCGLAVFSAQAFAEISPPRAVPTLHSVEWTIGPAILGSDIDTRGAMVVGLAIPVARVGTESELYVGFESGIAPVWDPFVAGIPLLAQGYVRMRLSEATALRFGLAAGAFIAVGSGNSAVGFLGLGTPAFDLHFTKHTRIVFEPAMGIGISSGNTRFAYYPRVMLGFSL